MFFLVACGKTYDASAYYQASKLEATDYKKVLGSQYKDTEVDAEFSQALLEFSYKTASELLEKRNGMYSPLSLYIALSELAELTAGDTRAEILNALNVNDIDILREGNQNLYKKLTYTNKVSTLSIANSIWLNKELEYKSEALEILRDKYYASSYGIDFSKTEDKEHIGKWVNDNTGGKLGKGDFDDLDESVVFVLLNAIYFYDEWETKFIKSLNIMDNFEGLNEKVEYMTQELRGSYYKNADFETSYLKFKNGLNIRFVAPNDSSRFEEFLNNSTKLESAFSLELSEVGSIKYIIPKYSFKSSFDLLNYTKSLGIQKVFGSGDFSPLTDSKLFVNAVYQKSFIEIDEDGGRAAAYTGIDGVKESMPMDPFTFKLDRPFIYAIYSGDYPIFIGTVTNPLSSAEEIYK
jgi:serpin B